MKLYHGIAVWHVTINDNCFKHGWESYCRDNLIHEYDLLFLRRRSHLTYDALSFGTTQILTLMPWTLPLPMVPNYQQLQPGNYSRLHYFSLFYFMLFILTKVNCSSCRCCCFRNLQPYYFIHTSILRP